LQDKGRKGVHGTEKRDDADQTKKNVRRSAPETVGLHGEKRKGRISLFGLVVSTQKKKWVLSKAPQGKKGVSVLRRTKEGRFAYNKKTGVRFHHDGKKGESCRIIKLTKRWQLVPRRKKKKKKKTCPLGGQKKGKRRRMAILNTKIPSCTERSFSS